MSFWAKDVRNGDLTSNRKPDGDSSSHLPPLPARKSSTNRRAPTFDRELSRSRWCDRHALRQQTCFVALEGSFVRDKVGNIVVDAVLRTGLCPCRSCGWLHRSTCSVRPSSLFSFRPFSPTHPPDFILPHFPPSFFTSSFTLVQTHSTHVLSPAFSFPPHFSQTPSHPLTRRVTFILHHFYVYYAASCVPDRVLPLFPCPFPFFPLLWDVPLSS